MPWFFTEQVDAESAVRKVGPWDNKSEAEEGRAYSVEQGAICSDLYEADASHIRTGNRLKVGEVTENDGVYEVFTDGSRTLKE